MPTKEQKRAVTNTLAKILRRPCPFCGEKELWFYRPKPHRPYWIMGCQSRKCDSRWRMSQDSCFQLLDALPPKK